MSSLWDFSILLSKFDEQIPHEIDTNGKYEEISEKLKTELDEISRQIALLDSNDTSVLNDLHLLTPPTNFKPETDTIKKENESILPKLEYKPIQVSTSAQPSGTNTPRIKKPLQLKPKKIIKPQKSIPKTPQVIFKATPNQLQVINFSPHIEYTMKFTLQNISAYPQGFQIRGPSNPVFRFKIIENVKNAQILPGLHITFEVYFLPTDLHDYDDSFIITPCNNDQPTVIPIHCYREPPQLQIPDIVDLQSALIYSSKTCAFTIVNKGGNGHFSFQSTNGKEESLIFIDGPFSLIPSQFQLNHNESIEINIKFKPLQEGEHSSSFEIITKDFPQKFNFVIKGNATKPLLKFDVCDEDILFIPFLPSDVNKTKTIDIINKSDVSYPYYIQLIKPRESKNNLKILYPEYFISNKTNNSAFNISPVSGLIGACETIKINIKFSPLNYGFYETKLVIFVNRIPNESGVLSSKKMLTIILEGSTGHPNISIFPPLIIFNNVIPYSENTQTIEIQNDSNVKVNLQLNETKFITSSKNTFEIESKEKQFIDLQYNLTEQMQNISTQNISLINNVNWPLILMNNNNSNYSKQLFLNNFNIIDDLSYQIDPNISFNFKYFAHISLPKLIIDPPTLDFGYVLIGTNSIQTIKLKNPFSSPIGFNIIYPNLTEWNINEINGTVYDEYLINVELKYMNSTSISEIITIYTFWVDNELKQIKSMPTTFYDIPVYAIIDRPIIEIKNRIIDIGEIFPSIEYSTCIQISLLNDFPTDFEIIDYLYEGQKEEENVKKEENIPLNIIKGNVKASSMVQISPDTLHIYDPIHRPSTQMNLQPTIKTNDKNDNNNNEMIFEREICELSKSRPSKGHLNIGESININVNLMFSELGKRLMPIIIKVFDISYTCVVLSHVNPPKIHLLDEKIDFSSDFVICKQSNSNIRIRNESGISSTIQIEVVDDCNGVFKLENDQMETIHANETKQIPISCYSEIHGEYNGKLKLIIRDYWQYKTMPILLHVKALGSFFNFQKHTLGYTVDDVYGDYVSFGKQIKVKGEKIIRRIALENFSSESIVVEWKIYGLESKKIINENNLEVKNETDLNNNQNENELNVQNENDSEIKNENSINNNQNENNINNNQNENNLNNNQNENNLDVKNETDINNEQNGNNLEDKTENDLAALPCPFKLSTDKTIIKSHGKTIVIVEFVPKEKGEFRGLLTVRSGEFIHKLRLEATCV